jgi:hypothetical protein
MKWKTFLLPSVCAAALLLAATLPFRADARRNGYRPNGRVTIDGKSFLAELPREPAGPVGAGRRQPFHPDALVASKESPPDAPPALPPVLNPEHTLSFEAESGMADIAVGRLQSQGPTARRRLAADGWVEPAGEDSGGSLRLLEKRNGKEKAIVFLDEADGTFLFLREGSR